VQLGKTSEAAPLLEVAVRWAGHDPEPAIALAQVYLALGDRSRAAAAAAKALEADPGSVAAKELVESAASTGK
jgi:predicted Zn-dependent protease